MVDASGRPTLIDFGASRAAMAGRSTTMTAIFTPGYAAAEQFTSAEARAVDRHLRAVGHALSRHHRQDPAERDRAHPEGRLPAVERAQARRLRAGASGRHRCRHGPPRRRPAPGHRRMAACAAHRRTPARGPGGDAGRAQARAGPGARRALRFVVPLCGPRPRPPRSCWLAADTSPSRPASRPPSALPRSASRPSSSSRRWPSGARPTRSPPKSAGWKTRRGRRPRRTPKPSGRPRPSWTGAAGATEGRAGAGRAQGAHRGARGKPQPRDRRPGGRGSAARRRGGQPSARRRRTPRPCARPRKKHRRRRRPTPRPSGRPTRRWPGRRPSGSRPRRKRGQGRGRAAARRQASEEASARPRRRPRADARPTRRSQGAGRAREGRSRGEDKAEAERRAKVKEEARDGREGACASSRPDRQRLQVALTSLGFDTRGSDGVLGPRSREMIAAWQKKVGAPATGFVTAAQREQLLRSAAPAIARWEEEQKKAEDEKKLKPRRRSRNARDSRPRNGSSSCFASSSRARRAGAGPPNVSAMLTRRDLSRRPGHLQSRADLQASMSNGSGTDTVASSTCVTAPFLHQASGNVSG